ncbi:MAG TPA: lysylphosphatidylglycerol synthase domain-containing protein [Egibacteraceae bacterium]|nr:lysylphosphatidylglycerol synthase domain-containing protein [Egibacteraceae bacterium]
MRKRLGTAARVLFGLAGAAFLIVAFWQTWDRSTDVVVPAWWRLVVALALIALAMSLAYRAWAQLFERPVRSRSLAAGFYISQLGKYVPGAVWQAVGQVGYARRAEVSLPRAATAFAVFAFTQAAAGALVGAGVALFVPGLAWWLRFGAVAAAALVILLDRRWMVWAIGVYRRVRPADADGDADDAATSGEDKRTGQNDRREPVSNHGREPVESLVPSQRAILGACAWSVGVMLAMGLAFVVLLGGLGTTAPSLPAAVSGYTLAWTMGFVAVPFPSGLGVREAVLIAVLGPTTGAAPLIAASVYFRLAQMLAEVLLILATRDWRVPRRC